EPLPRRKLPHVLRARRSRPDHLAVGRRATGRETPSGARPSYRFPMMMFREGGGRGPWAPREKVERPSDPAVRRAHGRRIVRLFRPYWAKLSGAPLLIVVS